MEPLRRRNSCAGTFCSRRLFVFPALRGAQVTGLLDGSDRAPAKTIEIEDSEKKKRRVPNPDYATWIACDQAVLSYLINLFSPDILAHVVGLMSGSRYS